MIKKKMPRDLAQLGKKILDITTGEDTSPSVEEGKNPHDVALGRLGGLKGGKARANKLTKEQRSKIAKKAVAARWEKKQ